MSDAVFSNTWRLLRPVVWTAILVGVARFVLTVGGAPRWAVYAASLTAVQILGSGYFAVRLAATAGGYFQLWAGILIIFGVCQSLYIAGLLYTLQTGVPTRYHETRRLVEFLGYEPSIPLHIGMHVLNWMVIAPSLMAWVIAAPLVWGTRRFRAGK